MKNILELTEIYEYLHGNIKMSTQSVRAPLDSQITRHTTKVIKDSTRPTSTTTKSISYPRVGIGKKRRYAQTNWEVFKSNRSIKMLSFSLIYNDQTQPATRKAHIRQLQEARNLNHNTKSSRNIDKVQSLSQITPLNRSNLSGIVAATPQTFSWRTS